MNKSFIEDYAAFVEVKLRDVTVIEGEPVPAIVAFASLDELHKFSREAAAKFLLDLDSLGYEVVKKQGQV